MKNQNIIIIKKRCKPLCAIKEGLITHSKGKIELIKNVDNKPEVICNLPLPKIYKFLILFRIFERILRLEPRTAIYDGNNIIHTSYNGKIISINIKNKNIIFEHKLRKGSYAPLNFSKIENITGFDNIIVFGEYWNNDDNSDVSIYCCNIKCDIVEWRKIYTFSKDKIRHIHNIIPDNYNNCVYILTGDKDSESGIWIAKNNFKSVVPLAVGNQKYRSCQLFPKSDNKLILVTDSPNKINSLSQYTVCNNYMKEDYETTIPGSCIYGVIINDKYMISTTVEPDPDYYGLRFYTTYKLGKGIADKYVHIFLGTYIYDCKEIAVFKKDFLPMALCQYGAVTFVYDNFRDIVYLYPIAVDKYDGKLCYIKN